MNCIIKSPEVFFAIAEIVEKTVREWGLRLERIGASHVLP